MNKEKRLCGFVCVDYVSVLVKYPTQRIRMSCFPKNFAKRELKEEPIEKNDGRKKGKNESGDVLALFSISSFHLICLRIAMQIKFCVIFFQKIFSNSNARASYAVLESYESIKGRVLI